jgi:hypothetical protein
MGGQQRSARSLLADDQKWYEYQQGVILRVNPETGAALESHSYVSPPEACGEDDPVLFKSGTLQGNTLYACTQTEVLLYELPSFKKIGYVSLPVFNDVHHVRPTPEGNLLVANSGLDMVLEMTPGGDVLREWNVLGDDPWAHFSKETDYRKGISTKPHRAHPNYVFYVGDDIWVTRFQQKDALCLTAPGKRIDIGNQHIHDGVLHEGLLYFTRVDGMVVIANPETLQIEEIVDLNSMADPGMLLGWCRGLMFDQDRMWVGFTRIRPTKFREAVSWVRQGMNRVMPTHIACYNLKQRKRITEIDVEAHHLNAVFSIFIGPDIE